LHESRAPEHVAQSRIRAEPRRQPVAEISRLDCGTGIQRAVSAKRTKKKELPEVVWRGSIAGIDCVRGVALNGKFQTMTRAADLVFVEAA
jgi:hypothetical protein